MKILDSDDVLELLRLDIDRVGSQSEWARRMGIERSAINKMLNGHILPSSSICSALKLKWVIVRRGSKPVVVSNREVTMILHEKIKKAGGIASLSRSVGVDRTHLSKVLHRRKCPSEKILAILNLTEVLIRANDSRTEIGNRGRQIEYSAT
jgi:DNA-binding phage protein